VRAPRSHRVAGWLLERCLSGPERDAVIGDILERHARSRSERWLWIETLIAITVTTVREIRAHVILVPAAAFLVGYGAAALVGTVKLFPGPAVLNQMLAGAAAGWVVGRLGRLPVLVTFAGIVLLSTLPRTDEPVFAFLDHFGGAWLIATFALRALPPSIVIAQLCIAAGGFAAIFQRTPAASPPGAASF
jgi:hypothetical protein